LSWAGLAVEVAVPAAAEPAVSSADQAEVTYAALDVVSYAEHVEAYAVPAAAASVGPVVDELDSAVVEAGSVVADAVLEDTAACAGRYQ
jgi:hypothetical protein